MDGPYLVEILKKKVIRGLKLYNDMVLLILSYLIIRIISTFVEIEKSILTLTPVHIMNKSYMYFEVNLLVKKIVQNCLGDITPTKW